MNGRTKKYSQKSYFYFGFDIHTLRKRRAASGCGAAGKENEIVFLATDIADGSRMGGPYYTVGKTSKDH